MQKNENGRSLIEMIAVLALIGIIGIGSIAGYMSATANSDANNISELVSIASLTGKTKMKNYDNISIWKVTGKKPANYKCIQTLGVTAKGEVVISFNGDSKCEKIQKVLKNQWGNLWNEGTSTYTPPIDEGAI